MSSPHLCWLSWRDRPTRSVVREGATFTIDLDQLESALAVSQAEKKPASLPVKNVPPEILIAFKPPQLVLVDGKPRCARPRQRRCSG